MNQTSTTISSISSTVSAPKAKRTRKAKVAEQAQTTEVSGNTALAPAPVATEQADLMAKLAELQNRVKAGKEEQERRERDAALAARNPQFVPGSLRKATEADVAALGVHSHGWVGEIRCERCGTIRLCNAQDLFQVKTCKACRKEAQKDKAKAKRIAKKNDPAKVAAEIERLQALLTSQAK